MGWDHEELSLQRLEMHAFLAGSAALRKDRDQEVHEVEVPAEHQRHIGRLSRKLVLPLIKCSSNPPPEDAKCHDDEAERPDTLAIGTRVIKKDYQEDAEGRFHPGLALEEEAQVLEHAKDHLDQEAGGVKDLERRVDLHHGQRDQHDVP